MRRLLVPLAIALSLVTGGVLAETGSLLADPGLPRSTAVVDANVALVEAFYAAANVAIGSGDTDGVARVVAEDFVEHAGRPGVAPTRVGLVRYLRSLHATVPGTRLTVLEVTAQDDRAVARVEATGDGGSFLGLPVGSADVWGTIDVFRIESDRIAEHWADAGGRALLEPLADASVRFDPPGWTTVALARRMYAPLDKTATTSDGPAIFLVESGSLVAELASGSSVTSMTLGAGETLVVPMLARVETRNVAREPAVALVVSLERMVSPEADPGMGFDEGEGGGAVETLFLAGGSAVPVPTGPVTVAMGRATLAPGAQIAPHRSVGTALIAVIDGRLTATVEEGDAWVQYVNRGSVPARDEVRTERGTALGVGDGARVGYRNAEPADLIALVLTIVPAEADVTALVPGWTVG